MKAKPRLWVTESGGKNETSCKSEPKDKIMAQSCHWNKISADCTEYIKIRLKKY